MKALKDLKATYGSEDISRLIDYVKIVPVELPEGVKYYFEKQGNAVHVYSIGKGINEYQIGTLEAEVAFRGAKKTSEGQEISLVIGEIEKIILHTKPYEGPIVTKIIQNTISPEFNKSGDENKKSACNYSSSGDENRHGRLIRNSNDE
ncbi:MAG: hypothetical protein ACP5N1_02605 [Candidatus Woesearchaeota archaeon]